MKKQNNNIFDTEKLRKKAEEMLKYIGKNKN